MIKAYLAAKKEKIEHALHQAMLTENGPFTDHISAMRYSLFIGGKRVRPILCLAAAEAISDDPVIIESLLPVACALECVHTYSLIHDDLPAMDDDNLRRGKPTNHVVHGEAAAILAGDGLLTYAFEILSRPQAALPEGNLLRIIQIIARAAGPEGMVGGQSLDIANERIDYPFEMLRTIHRSKTGALITASVLSGGLGAGASEVQQKRLQQYGERIGLAFQIVDDLLDATATTQALGKTAGSDEQRGKATYPAFFGVEETRKKAQAAVEEAKAALSDFDERANPLRELADYIYLRGH
jgi:geranylgeranyl diphosphate synthase type II